MSGTKSRRAHSPELKAKVGLKALRRVKTINEIAQECEVHPVQVSQWKKGIREQAQRLVSCKRGPKPAATWHPVVSEIFALRSNFLGCTSQH
ncbi:transposase [Allohahella marinimesophila]|uniref:Transposase n=1 Tax=Allohahella marinimesophila TaxID=1054972 RepID=A0ABP7Q7L7_9GAMM